MSKKKIKAIIVRASEDEIKSFDLKAKAVGLSRNALLRKKLQGFPIRPSIVPPVNWQVYKELAAIATELKNIGNKINQVREEDSQSIPLQEITVQIQQLQRLIRETRLEITGSKDT